MKLLPVLLLALLGFFAAPNSALAANRYVDSSCPTSGNGGVGVGGVDAGINSVTVCGATGPYKNLSDVPSWATTTNTYFKGGNTYTGACGLLVAGSGASSSDRLTIGAYGTVGTINVGLPVRGRQITTSGVVDKAKIVCTSGSYVFAFVSRSNLRFQDLDVSAFAVSAISVNNCFYSQGTAGSHFVEFLRIYFRQCGGAVALEANPGTTTTYQYDNYRVGYSEFGAVQGVGFGNGSIPRGNNQTWFNLELDNSYFGPTAGIRSDFASVSGMVDLIQAPKTYTVSYSISSTAATVTAGGPMPLTGPIYARPTASTTAPIADGVTYTSADGLALTLSAAATRTASVVSFGSDSSPQNTIANLSFHGNNLDSVYRGNLSAAIFALRMFQSPQKLPVSTSLNCVRESRFLGTKVYDNYIANAEGGLAFVENGVNDATYGLQYMTGNQAENIKNNSVLGSFFNVGMLIADNYVNGVRPQLLGNATGIDGMGINVDYCSLNNIVTRNFITGALGVGSSVDNTGQGIGVFAGGGHIISSNITIANRHGIAVSDYGAGDPTSQVLNNTMALNLVGLNQGFTFNLVLIAKNNLFFKNSRSAIEKGNATYGITAGAGLLITEDYNDFFGNGANFTGTGTIPSGLATHDLAVDPLLLGGATPVTSYDVRLSSASTLKCAGTSIGFALDFTSRPFEPGCTPIGAMVHGMGDLRATPLNLRP